MKEIKNCKIVQDLLPNYIEGLTNEESNLFIENHLKECSICKKTFENMKQELNIAKPNITSKEVRYLKKFNKKLLILRVLVFILLIISLGVMTYHYTTMKNAYNKASNIMVDMAKDGRYPDTFYATIENISDSGVYGIKTITVKGLDVNDRNHRGLFQFDVILDNIGDNFKIKWNNRVIGFEELKVGQKIAVYNYGDTSETILNSVKMLIVLDDNL